MENELFYGLTPITDFVLDDERLERRGGAGEVHPCIVITSVATLPYGS